MSVQGQDAKTCFIVDRKSLSIEEVIEGKSSLESANTITLDVSHTDPFGPDKTIACGSPWVKYDTNEAQICSHQQIISSYSLYPFNCNIIDPSGCGGENCWFPPEGKETSLVIAQDENAEKSYFKVNVSHICNCDIVGCSDVVTTRTVRASLVSFNVGHQQKSCHFVKRSVLIKKSETFEEVGSTIPSMNSISENSISANLGDYSFGEYEWKIRYKIITIKTANESFESNTKKLCILGSISDPGLLTGSSFFGISSTSSNPKVYLAKAPFIVQLHSPSGCASFSLARFVSLSCDNKIYNAVGANTISTSAPQLNCELSQYVSDVDSFISTPTLNTSHQFLMVDFSVKTATIEKVGTPTPTIYQAVVTTHSGASSLVSETFTITHCSAFNDGVVQSSGLNRFIRFQCSGSVQPIVTLKIGSLFSSSSITINLDCVPSLPIPSFTISSIPTKFTETYYKYALDLSTALCPNSCGPVSSSSGFIINAIGMTSKTVNCGSTISDLSIPKSTKTVEICSFIKHYSQPEFKECVSHSLNPSTIELTDFSITSVDPGSERDFQKLFSVTLKTNYDVSSVIVKAASNAFFIPLTFDGSSYVGSRVFDNVATSYSCVVIVDQVEFSDKFKTLYTELYSQMTLSSANAPIFGKLSVNLSFSVNWGTSYSSRSFTVEHHCSDKSGKDLIETVTKACPNKCSNLPVVSSISLNDFGYSSIGNTVLYCTFFAVASNGKDSVTLSKRYQLNTNQCIEDPITSVSPPTIPHFVIPSLRNPRCQSIAASETSIILDNSKATVSCERTTIPFCSDGSFEFSSDGFLSSLSPNAPSFLLSLPSSITNLSVSHKIGYYVSEKSTLEGLSLCNSTPSLSPSIISTVVFVSATQFYPFSQTSSIEVSDGFTLSCPSHSSLFSRQTQIDQQVGSEKISFTPGTSGFTVTADALYCGSGHSSKLPIVSASKTFTNCLSGLTSPTETYLSFWGTFIYFPSIGFLLKPTTMRNTDTVCGRPITFRLQLDSNPVIDFVNNGFRFPGTYYDSFSSSQSLKLLLSLPSQTDFIEKATTISICKLVHPTLSNFRVMEVFGDYKQLSLSWDSNGGNLCGSSCNVVISISDHSGAVSLSPGTTSTILKDIFGSPLVSGETLTFELYSQCKDEKSNEYDRTFLSDRQTVTKVLCFPTKPKISNFKCSSCISVNQGYYIFLISPKLNFDISFDVEPGVDCSYTHSDYLKFTFDSSSYVEEWSNPTKRHHSFSFSPPFAGNHEDQIYLAQYSSTFVLNSFNIVLPYQLSRCVVPTPNGNPFILNAFYEYFTFNGGYPFYQIKFSGINNLYSPCFKQGHYQLEYHTYSDPSKTVIFDTIIFAEKNQKDRVFDFVVSKADVYYYRIVGLNGIDEKSESVEKVLHVCSETSFVEPPILLEPTSDSNEVSVQPTFKWELSVNTIIARCSASDTAFVKLEIEKTSIIEMMKDEDIEFGITLLGLFTSISAQLPSEQLFSLSTQYSWRLTVIHENKQRSELVSSEIFKFTTVSKHCAYMNCNHGTCDEVSIQCVCSDGFKGEFCDQIVKSGLSTGALIGIIVGAVFVAVALIVVLIVVIARKRRSTVYKLDAVLDTYEITAEDTAFQ